MKRMLWLALVCCVLLAGCKSSPAQTTYTKQYGGKTFQVDTVNKTIQVDDYSCQYSLDITPGVSGSMNVEYPDGSWCMISGQVTETGFLIKHLPSQDFVTGRYEPGNVLWNVLDANDIIKNAPQNSPMFQALAILFALLGFILVTADNLICGLFASKRTVCEGTRTMLRLLGGLLILCSSIVYFTLGVVA